jgi:hypothetical protein
MSIAHWEPISKNVYPVRHQEHPIGYCVRFCGGCGSAFGFTVPPARLILHAITSLAQKRPRDANIFESALAALTARAQQVNNT